MDNIFNFWENGGIARGLIERIQQQQEERQSSTYSN